MIFAHSFSAQRLLACGLRGRNWGAAASLGLVLACGSAPPPAAQAEPPLAAKHPHAPRSTPKLELAPNDVVYALRGEGASMRECFGNDAATARGFVRLAWKVTPSGTVRSVRVEESSVDDESVGGCLSEHLRALRFQPPPRTADARWTFVFGLYEPPPATLASKAKEKPRKKKKKRHDARDDEKVGGLVIEPSSTGYLEPDAIEGVVQSGYGLFARCYRDALARDPKLGGAVRLRLAIESDGRVRSVKDGGSEMPDPTVIDCVAEGFFALQFPEPRRGRVDLLYRILFDSG